MAERYIWNSTNADCGGLCGHTTQVNVHGTLGCIMYNTPSYLSLIMLDLYQTWYDNQVDIKYKPKESEHPMCKHVHETHANMCLYLV